MSEEHSLENEEITKIHVKEETMEDFKEELEASFRTIRTGDVLTGTIVNVSEDEITLDLGYYAPGIIPSSELSDDPDFSIHSLEKGATLKATVVKRDDGNGNILLSAKAANEAHAWDVLFDYLTNRTIQSVKVKEAVNAGVICYLEGIRAFIPASLLSTSYVEDTSEFIGKVLDVRVVTVDEKSQKLILSAKDVALEKETDTKNEKISLVVPGSVLTGTVESLMPYGAFIHLENGLSGLVHISQICEKRIKKPSEVLKEGQQVKVKVLNTDNHKISLSMRALEEEMFDGSSESVAELEAYTSKEEVSTSLSSLLNKFKF